MNSHVIAENVLRNRFFNRRIELIAKPRIELFQEGLRRPALTEKQILHARPVPMFPQALLIAEEFGDFQRDAGNLVLPDEGVQTHCQEWFLGETAADPHGKSHLIPIAALAHRRRKTYVVDFRVGAPDRAADNGNLELPRQVVKLRVDPHRPGDIQGEG